MTEQEKVLAAEAPISPEELKNVLASYNQNAQKLLDIETQIAIINALILSSKSGIVKKQKEIMASELSSFPTLGDVDYVKAAVGLINYQDDIINLN